MKKIFLPLLLGGVVLATLTPALAQERLDTVFQKREVIIIEEDDQPIVNQGTREVIIRNTTRGVRTRNKRDQLQFFNGIGLGYNGLVEDLGNMKLPEDARWMDLKAKSINFNLSIMKYQHNFTRYFGLRTGLEMEINNYRFTENMRPKRNEDTHIVEPEYMEYNLKKSKLVNCYLNVPLLANFTIGRHLEIYGGMVGGWRFNSYSKIKSSEHGKERTRRDLNLRNFHYGYTAGITFHDIGFYATYYPHSMFKADMGPDVHQVSVGIVLSY